MIIYSQRDPRWRGVPIGVSGRTIGQIGCLVTSISMLSTYFMPGLIPPQVVDRAKFTRDGLLYWNSLELAGFKFYWRAYGPNHPEIARHIKHPDLAVLLEVANKSHWVVAIGQTFLSGSYKIADPLFGDKATMARYQNNITGAAYFKRA